MLGGLISAGAGLLGGLFGGGDDAPKEQVVRNEVDYKKMASEAAKAGFNPLTAIRNGGSAGFSTTTTTVPGTSSLPGVLANIGGVLGAAFDKQVDPLKAPRQQDTALVDYQLRQIAKPSLSTPALYPGGTFTGTKVTRNVAPMGPVSASRNPFGYNQENAQVTQFGNQDWWKRNPWTPDGATYEDAYGELGGSALGVTSFLADIGYNAARWTHKGYDYAKKNYKSWHAKNPMTIPRTMIPQRRGRNTLSPGSGGGGW